MLPLLLSHSLLFALLQAAAPTQIPTNKSATTQAAAPSLANSATPTDPKELLDLGRKVNGLTGPDIQPWHMKASFEIFDDDGKSKDKGTFEEWWVSDKQYKVIYSSTAFSQIDFGTDHGLLRTGNPHWPIGPVSFVRARLVHPLPSEDQSDNLTPEIAERDFGSVKLRCVVAKSKLRPKGDPPIPPTYCFALEKPFLRYSSSVNASDAITYSRILLFQSRYIGGDIEVVHLSKPYVDIHVESLNPIETVNPTEFQPPSDALLAPMRETSTESGFVPGKALNKITPDYPPKAKAQGTQGTVTIQAIIGKDGHILDNLRVVSGPPDLQESALASARQWVYSPYLLNGQPVEVEVIVKVAFFLPKR